MEDFYSIRITEGAGRLLQRNNGVNPYSIIAEVKNRLEALEEVVIRLEYTMDKITVKYKLTANEVVFYVSKQNKAYNAG